MLQRTSRRLWWHLGLAALSAAGLSAACSSKTQTSGETHFVSCHSDAECASLGADYSCQAEKCQIRTDSGVTSCGAGCTPAYGYPIDDSQQCVDLPKKEIIGCWCDGSASSNCRVRKSDGKVFVGEVTSLFKPDDFEVCGAGGDPTIVPEHSCDFVSCILVAHPPPMEGVPPSWCSVEDTCAALGCDSLVLNAAGCTRPVCSTDADCFSGDRCVVNACAPTSICGYDAHGTCQCSGPTICMQERRCNSTQKYGPAGDWSALEFTQASGPCPTPGGCTSTWRLTPDGQLAISKSGAPSTATVDAASLDTIRGFIDGPELRRGLRDGLTCDPPPTDVGWQVKLELSTGPLQSDATGCLTTGPSGNIAQQIFDYLKNY